MTTLPGLRLPGYVDAIDVSRVQVVEDAEAVRAAGFLAAWAKARDAETADLKGLAAYDQARTWDRAAAAGARARALREARERAGATCP